jgi:hypothetical protein
MFGAEFGSEIPAGAPMEDQLKQILESLPEKPPRSRLAPYREFIEELRWVGRTYRDIAAILAGKCQLNVSASAIHDFVRIHGGGQRKRSARNLEGRRSSARPEREPADNIVKTDSNLSMRERILALKLSEQTSQPDREVFQFDASEPLRLGKSSQK